MSRTAFLASGTALIVGVGALLIANLASSSTGADIVVEVNGRPVTRQTYTEYAAVLIEPDGRLRVAPVQVLTSLVNQELVRQEAEARGITISDQEIARVVEHWDELGVGDTSLDRAGGREAFAERVRTFVLFERVKEVVLGVPEISDEAVLRAYEADPALKATTFEQAAPVLRLRLQRDAIARQWEEWLRSRRLCAEIRVPDGALGLGSSTPMPACVGQ